MNPFRYQHEKLGDAVSALLQPDVPFERRLAIALGEFSLAFHQGTPSDSALEYYLKIKEIMGEGNFEERAKTLTAIQRSRVVSAFWELDRKVSRDYYTYEVHR